jgi:hypothetical protein
MVAAMSSYMKDLEKEPGMRRIVGFVEAIMMAASFGN